MTIRQSRPARSSGNERVTRETAKALARKNLDMDFGGAAIINDAASGERYEIARASRLSCLIAKGGVAVIWPVFLRPAHECCYPAAVEHRCDCRCRSGQVQRDAVAFRQVTGLGVAAIIAGIAFKAGIGEFADDLGKAEAPVLRGIEAGSGDSNPFCVHSPCSSSEALRVGKEWVSTCKSR